MRAIFRPAAMDKHSTPADTPVPFGVTLMPFLHEQVETRLPIDAAFAFLADFGNAPTLGSGTVTSTRLDDGPLRVGSRFAVGVRMGDAIRPMTYEIVALEPDRQVVLQGIGSGVAATDTMSFERTPDGTRIDYTADIRLLGWRRVLEPFARGTFSRIARAARAGMERALAERVARQERP